MSLLAFRRTNTVASRSNREAGGRPSSSRLPVTAGLALCVIAIGSSPPAVAVESLEPVRLVLRQTDAGGVTASNRPRLAVLLIDCSSSMNLGIDANESLPKGPQNPGRWEEMKAGVQKTLDQLLVDSKGIEVRIRFFSSRLDQFRALRERLDGQANVDAIMAELNRMRPDGTTVLYEATTKVAEEIARDNKSRQYEWILLGVFSDGKDGTSPPPYTSTKRDEAIKRLMDEAGLVNSQFVNLVFKVGPQATGNYGAAEITKLGDTIPKPPRRPPSYALELAAGQPSLVDVKQPAKSGGYSLPVVLVEVPKELEPSGMRVVPEIDKDAAFRLASQGLSLAANAPTSVALDLPTGVNVRGGASAVIGFRPAESKDGFVCTGFPQVRLVFAANETLDPSEWRSDIPRAVERGASAALWIDPGKATNFTWTFRSPDGKESVSRQEKSRFERSFDTAGTWGVAFSCTGQDGSQLPPKKPHPLSNIEVVDGSFKLDPQDVTVDAGAEARFAIVKKAGATSAVAYSADLGGLPVTVSGTTLVISGTTLSDVGRYIVSVTGSMQAGGRPFTWTDKANIRVRPGAKIERVRGQDEVKSGGPLSIPPGREAAFQLTNVDAQKIKQIDWKVRLPGESSWKDEPKQEDFIHLTPSRCGTLAIQAVVTTNDGQTLNPVEAHFDVIASPPSANPKLAKTSVLIGTKTVAVEPNLKGTFKTARLWLVPKGAPHDAPPVLEPKTFDQDPGTVQIDLPEARLGVGRRDYEVRVEMEGYPGCVSEWKQLSPPILKVVPRAKVEIWALALLILGAIWKWLYDLLWGNEPMRWWIDYAFSDPGPPMADGGGNYSIYIADKMSASGTHRTHYLGWSRQRKEAFVPLWLFADRADSTDASWLNDPRWSEATLKIIRYWQNPFVLTGDLGTVWKSENPHGDLESTESISRTLRLQPPWDGAGQPPAIWMRMHAPRGRDPLLWILWIYTLAALACLAWLIPYLGLVPL